MINTITKAAENFCTHQIGSSYEIKNEVKKTRTIIAYIDITSKSGEKYRVFIAADYGFAQIVSKLFLEEDESDEQTLIDMMLETTNLIVGSAKVIADDDLDNESFVIGTPIFDKIDDFDTKYKEVVTINVDENNLFIAIKELN
ncbi:MAG: chemotaxis protein CheX [Campylobacterales bacterium]|nr:chemotaxis protein CheX [Campylobacterales bacterium]